MSKYAEDDEGNLYVVANTSWGRTDERLANAASLTEAKRLHGWSGMRYTTTKVRRATWDDVERLRRRSGALN